MDKRKVYVTQYFPRGDFSAAEKFGEVTFITDKEHRPEPALANANDEVQQDIVRALSEYNQGYDFLLLAPSQIINVIVGFLLDEGEHKILKWDNRSRNYRIHKVYV